MNEMNFKLPLQNRGNSAGEQHLSEVLQTVTKQLNTFYSEEMRIGYFDGKRRRADFCIPYNGKLYLIEFDGIQHSQAVSKFGGSLYLSEIKKRDKWENLISRESNNIYLIRYKIFSPDSLKPHNIKLNYNQVINLITPDQIIKDMEKAKLGAFVQNGRLYHSRYR